MPHSHKTLDPQSEAPKHRAAGADVPGGSEPVAMIEIGMLREVLGYVALEATELDPCNPRGFCGPAIERIQRLDADFIAGDDVNWFMGHVAGGCAKCGPAILAIGEMLETDRGMSGTVPESPSASCGFVRDRMAAYLEDSLSTEEWLLFSQHCQHCRACFDLVEKMEMTFFLAAAELRSRPLTPVGDGDPADDAGRERTPAEDPQGTPQGGAPGAGPRRRPIAGIT